VQDEEGLLTYAKEFLDRRESVWKRKVLS
jgi:hypothetical protein